MLFRLKKCIWDAENKRMLARKGLFETTDQRTIDILKNKGVEVVGDAPVKAKEIVEIKAVTVEPVLKGIVEEPVQEAKSTASYADLDRDTLYSMVKGRGIKTSYNTGKPKLIKLLESDD
jgi:hypothetical protein